MKTKGLIVLMMVLFVACAGQNVPSPPALTPDADMAIYETFHETKAKWNATHDLIVSFTKLVDSTGSMACDAGITQLCDAKKAYDKFYDEQLQPASVQGAAYYVAAVKAYRDYRNGTGDDATLQEKLALLENFLPVIEKLFGQAKEIWL